MRNKPAHNLEPQENPQEQPKEVLSTPLSIRAYLLWIAFWSLMLYFEYAHTFDSSFLFKPFIVGKKGFSISLMWLLILSASSLATVPWRHHRKPLGLLGQTLVLIVICLKFLPLFFS